MIIAFGYYQDVGKNSCAKHLERSLRLETRNARIIRVGFASKVKSVAFDLFKQYGLMPEDYYETPATYNLKNEPLPIGKTPRDLWIHVGNHLRLAHDSIWADYVMTTYGKSDFLIIPDLRFPTEFKAIKDNGGYCYMIERPGRQPKDDGADNKLDKSYPWDGIIHNTGDFRELYAQVDNILRSLK